MAGPNKVKGATANRFAVLFLVLWALQGCANLTAVREFGKTAAEVSSYGDAGRAYQESARTMAPYVAAVSVQANRPEARQAQVKAASAVQASVAAYFATLAKLAGEDSFSLDKQLDAVGKGLQSLPSDALDPETAGSAIALAKTLQKYVLARAQSAAVKELVKEGGPPAMRLLSRLESAAASWRGAIENDSKTVSNSITVLAQAKDTPPLLQMLARDRQQQHLIQYEQSLSQVDTAIEALRRIRAAHEVLAANLNSLGGNELQALLKEAVADLKEAKKSMDALR